MLLPHGAVIALVDGKNFELFRNDGNDGAPELTALTAPKLDNQNHSGGGHHSSAGNHADSQVTEDSHAIAVVDWLNKQVLDHKIEMLVIFASPRTLGEMRRHYHKQTRLAVLKEIDKDFTGRKSTEILAALREGH